MGQWSQSSWLLSLEPIRYKSNLAFLLARWRYGSIFADLTSLWRFKSCLRWSCVTIILAVQSWFLAYIASLLTDLARSSIDADFTAVFSNFTKLLANFTCSRFSKLLTDLTQLLTNLSGVRLTTIQPNFTTLQCFAKLQSNESPVQQCCYAALTYFTILFACFTELSAILTYEPAIQCFASKSRCL